MSENFFVSTDSAKALAMKITNRVLKFALKHTYGRSKPYIALPPEEFSAMLSAFAEMYYFDQEGNSVPNPIVSSMSRPRFQNLVFSGYDIILDTTITKMEARFVNDSD